MDLFFQRFFACSGVYLTDSIGQPFRSAPSATVHQKEQAEGRARWSPLDADRFRVCGDAMMFTIVPRTSLSQRIKRKMFVEQFIKTDAKRVGIQCAVKTSSFDGCCVQYCHTSSIVMKGGVHNAHQPAVFCTLESRLWAQPATGPGI